MSYEQLDSFFSHVGTHFFQTEASFFHTGLQIQGRSEPDLSSQATGSPAGRFKGILGGIFKGFIPGIPFPWWFFFMDECMGNGVKVGLPGSFKHAGICHAFCALFATLQTDFLLNFLLDVALVIQRNPDSYAPPPRSAAADQQRPDLTKAVGPQQQPGLCSPTTYG